MTYHIVVSHKDRNIVVKVDTHNRHTAEELASWVVMHHAQLSAKFLVAHEGTSSGQTRTVSPS
jgi:hypothetical protein